MFHTMDPSWPRREHFYHYMDAVRCTYSLTVQIDVTALRHVLKSNNLRTYPAQIYMLAAAVNRFPQFRMGVSGAGEPGYWDEMHPAYTVFNAKTETFSCIWTPYSEDFRTFYHACTQDMESYQNASALFPKKDAPPNTFDVSSVPWIDFTAFNLNVYTAGKHLPPIFTIGKYIEQDGKTLLPLAMQLHHAACDGYHAGQFVETLREMSTNCENWLPH